jgi:hypothetical protein
MMSARFRILPALCLAAVLALGLQVAYALVLIWCGAVGSQFFPSDDSFQSLRYLADGTPLIVTHSFGRHYDYSVETLDGEMLPREALQDQALSTRFAGRRPRSAGHGWPARIRGINDGRIPPVFWYLIHTEDADGRAYFVGYESETKRCIGYIGVSGARLEKPPPEECFPVDGRRMSARGQCAAPSAPHPWEPIYSTSRHSAEPMRGWMVYLVSQGRVLEIDLQKQSVRTVLEAEGIVSIELARRCRPAPDAEPSHDRIARSTYLAVQLLDRVLVVDPRGPERRSYPLPGELHGEAFEFLELFDGTALIVMMRRAVKTRRPTDLYWIGESEGTIRKETVELLYPAKTDPRLASALASLVAPVPAGWTVAATVVVPFVHLRDGEAAGYRAALGRALGELWPGVAVAFLLAAASTWFGLRRQRQYALPGSPAWAAFVFLLGVPGLLGYLFHRAWPVRKPCPACHAQVPRDRDACAACHAAFPEPAREGTEVFA